MESDLVFDVDSAAEDVQGRTEDGAFPGAGALRDSALLEQCPLRGPPKCPPASKRYRTHDGTCNNFNRARWGSTMTPVQRFIQPSYSDGLQAPRRSVLGRQLPSPREISASIHEDQDAEADSITHLLMQWGQFVDHDIASSSQTRGFNGSVPRCCKDGGKDFVSRELMHPECLPIAVPAADRFYGPLGVRCLEFVRSSPAPRHDCALGWREQANQVSAFLDASPLYGSSAAQSDRLRLFRNGMLQYGRVQQRRPLLPPERSRKDALCRGGAVSTDCFKSGDNRVNEHPGLVAAHIVWMRQHNRMATELAHLNPQWSDEKIYQETRKIVGAMVQHITYNEFLPIVLGAEVMRLFDLEPVRKGFYKNYNPKVNPSPASSFGSAAFRFGHSLVQPSMVRFDSNHRSIHNNVSLHDEPSNPSNLWSLGAVDRLLLGMLNQPIQKRDEFITKELTNHLFQTPQFPFGMDLAAINIQRGRDHGVPAYTQWREPCGLTRISTFEDLFRVMPSRVVRKLQDIYRHVDDIDLFTGGMAERPVVGGLVGPTFACIIAQQFSNLRKGDRFWYENGAFESSFTPAQLQQIRRISLAQILCKTLDTIETVQPFVFQTANPRDNRRISCSSSLLNNFDLSPWTEIDSTLENTIDFEKNEKVTKKPDRLTTRGPEQKPNDSIDATKKKTKPSSLNNLTKAHIIMTQTKTSIKQDVTFGQNKSNVTKLDDKLDFRNKSKRYDDSEQDQDADSSRPQHYYDKNKYEHTNDDVFQQGIVVNNNRHTRPNKYDRPVIAVTENIDKFTYLINYVPRAPPRSTPRPWKQTTRHPYKDRDVVKVTYQNYDETYRRPQHDYSGSHHSTYYNRPIDVYDDYKRQRPDLHTTRYAGAVLSSARSNDYNPFTTETFLYKEKYDFPATSTETFNRLVTFSHLGTYGQRPDNKDNDNTNYQSEERLPTDVNSVKDSYSKDFSLNSPAEYGQDNILNIDKMITTIPSRLSTFFPINKDFRPELTKPTADTDQKINDKDDDTKKSNVSPGRYYYAANVLHKYPDAEDTLNKTETTNIDKPITEGSYDNHGQLDNDEVQERSSVDSLIGLDLDSDKEQQQQLEKEGKVRVVKPGEATHSVAFEVIPSENSPSTWAVYEEKSDIHDAVPHAMPSVQSDPQALSELPRPINLASLTKHKKRKPQA